MFSIAQSPSLQYRIGVEKSHHICKHGVVLVTLHASQDSKPISLPAETHPRPEPNWANRQAQCEVSPFPHIPSSFLTAAFYPFNPNPGQFLASEPTGSFLCGVMNRGLSVT